MDTTFTSEHDVDVRPLIRQAVLDKQRAIRAYIDFALVLQLLDGTYVDAPVEGVDVVKAGGSKGKGKERATALKASSSQPINSGIANGEPSVAASPATVQGMAPYADDLDSGALARLTSASANPITTTKGRKRAAPEIGAPPPKRAKLNDSNANPSLQSASPIIIPNDTFAQDIPMLPVPEPPVFSFTQQFHLHLIAGPAVEDFPPSSRFLKVTRPDVLAKDESDFVRKVTAMIEDSGKESLEIGRVVLANIMGRVGIAAIRPHGRSTSKLIDFRPPAPLGGEGVNYDFTESTAPPSLLHAALQLALVSPPRVNLRSTLHVSRRIDREARRKSAPSKYLALSFQLVTTVNVLSTILSDVYLLHPSVQEAQRLLLIHLFPLPAEPVDYPGATSVSFFYDTLRPAPALPEDVPHEILQPEGLEAILLPFQKRSVGWLLAREGVKLSPSKEIAPLHSSVCPPIAPLYEPVQTPLAPGRIFYFSTLTGSFVENPPRINYSAVAPWQRNPDMMLGGMLSEEMGLGKTLECLALVLLNQAPAERGPWVSRYDARLDLQIREIKTTLIVSPASLVQQWADEIGLHAPGMKVLVYKGWKKETTEITGGLRGKKGPANGSARKKDKGSRVLSPLTDEEENELDEKDEKVVEAEDAMDTSGRWAHHANTYDIVLTTFDDLSKEFYVSQKRRERPKRGAASYQTAEGAEQVRSPLVGVEWWRVIMDEVQLQGNGLAAGVVSLIPRRSSLAVSGTPVQSNIRDLVQVLKFLRAPLMESQRLWNRFLQPGFASDFVQLFQRIAIRTSKAQVADELTIPMQRRYLVPVELGPVERHLYDELLETAYHEIGVDAQGNPLNPEAPELDTSQVRTWLVRLRQSCTHPQIGQLQRGDRVLGGALRSITEVLELMKYQNRQLILNEKRDRLDHKLKHALMIQQDETNMLRWKVSMDIIVSLKEDIQKLVEEVRTLLDSQIAAARAQRQAEKENALGRPGKSAQEDNDGDDPSKHKGKGRGRRAETPDSDDEWLDDSEYGHNDTGKAGGPKENRMKTLKVRTRECHVLQHKIFFALGDVYHKLGKAEEEEAYAQAEQIRRTVLKNAEDLANRATEKLVALVAEKGVNEKELEVAHCGQGGIRGRLLYAEADDISDLLNEQRELLWKWRGILFTRLTEKLSGKDDANGEEYNDALNAQGDAEAYLQAYAALLADRKEALSQERTALAAHDIREENKRRTNAAVKAAADAPPLELEPEHLVLARDLMKARKSLRDDHSRRPLKALVIELSDMAGRAEREQEGFLLRQEAVRLRKVVTDQEILNGRLEAELVHFRQAFNGRVLYFRQLQDISDSVAEFSVADLGGKSLDEATLLESAEVRRLDEAIRSHTAKQRYLEYMEEGERRDISGAAAESRDCILCSTEFERGCLTSCGHIYCEDCLKAWLKKAHKFCPVCRAPMTHRTVHRISFESGKKVEETGAYGADVLDGPSSQPTRPVEYNVIDRSLLGDIQAMTGHGQYGSKVQTLVQHLLWVKENDPDAKSIVFSAWHDSLNIVARALQENGISHLRVEGKRNTAREFRLDPGCRVLLLHGERENAGLNVTCANRVFLLEPVVNHAFEVQAIGRVDRMGQKHQTEVYCYYAIDTVEKGVLDLAAKNGLSIYTKGQAADTLNLNALGPDAVQQSPRKGKKGKGDFMAREDDMLAILFPHLREGVDLHEDDRMDVDPHIEAEVALAVRREEMAAAAERRAQMQAGPSRLA